MTDINNAKDEVLDLPGQTDNKKRSGCLAVFLVVMIVLNIGSAILYVVAGDFVQEQNPLLTDWSIQVITVLALVNALAAFFVWKWKRIGVYLFVGSAIIIFGINMSLGIDMLTSLFGLLGPVILFFLVRPVWKHMD